ncbi:hypothetical protein [Conexibacter sp. SYSU D00693]|uniref:hypothetical protein n=1 Tax=Conexibacter sp. SYSU D00693 TaxID=2812560 RepID=UPI00196A66A9|nr:hypothetical protein [Conexibacter sp. SYSU D00693]
MSAVAVVPEAAAPLGEDAHELRRLARAMAVQRWAATLAFLVPPVVLLALFGTGLMPPQPANHSDAQIAAFYAEHTDLRIAGIVVSFLAIGLVGPLVAAISMQMLRVEGRHPTMAFLQLVAGAVVWVMLTVPLLIMLVAAYRADRDPALTRTLHDLAWVMFLIPIAPFVVQNVAIAVTTFSDDAAEPVFPRWVAWANLLIAASFLPDVLLGFFHSGPFAVQGLAAFWIPTVTYGLWLPIMAWATRRAVLQQQRLEGV